MSLILQCKKEKEKKKEDNLQSKNSVDLQSYNKLVQTLSH